MNNYLSTTKKGSSETTREAFDFNFSKYIETKPEHNKNVDQNFLEWFIGFTEGDGSFITYSKKIKPIKRCVFLLIKMIVN